MRYQGKVSKWLDSKGYGFVVINGESDIIFAHINDFHNRASRPQVGDLVTFEVVKNSEKGRKAEHIEYVDPQATKSRPKEESRDWSAYLIALVLIICMTGYWMSNKSPKPLSVNEPNFPEPAKPVQAHKQNPSFQCSGKTRCSEMVSCDEAKFYLNNCPGSVTDGDHDGIPCEDQWCGH